MRGLFGAAGPGRDGGPAAPVWRGVNADLNVTRIPSVLPI